MTDAIEFSALWTMVFGFLAGVPLTVALFHSALRGGVPSREHRAKELYRLMLEEEIYGDQCFSCRGHVEEDWLRCPTCASALRGRCLGCGETVKLHWSACPWCAESLLKRPAPLLLPEPDVVLADAA